METEVSKLSMLQQKVPLTWTIPPVTHLESREIPECCSRAAKSLTRQVLEATTDQKAIIFQAPPGSGKTFIASFIHCQSWLKDTVFVEIDCAQLPKDETGQITLNGLFGDLHTRGVIEELKQGTLLIDNVHLLSHKERDRLLTLLKKRESSANQVRLILASPTAIDSQGADIHRIRLFGLSQRREDIPLFANYFLKKICQKQNRPILQLSQVVLRRLVSYDYPHNLAELEIILTRAVLMTPLAETVISEQALWSVQAKKNTFRLDLLEYVPGLRQFLLSKWWLKPFWWLHMALFIPLIISGLMGSHPRGQSLTLNIFWAWWWPFYLLLFPIVGRLWCAVCPFMITGEWIQKISLWIYPRQLRAWPNKWLNQWGAWCVWGGFLVIYLWEKLWDLPHSAYLSTWLLLIITAGAVLFSLIYERRLWCRYLCPIGGMNGMFAKLSMIELRATEQFCGQLCTAKACQKPTGASNVTFAEALPQEGQASKGCPIYSLPAQLSNNRDCVLCMGCIKSCPNRSVQLNLRFPAADLWENHRGFAAEVALLLLLLGGVFLHNSQAFLSWFGFGYLPVDFEHFLVAVPTAIALLSLPAITIYVTHKISQLLDPQLPDYVTMAYVYLPMTLAANLAYYLPSLITESGKILPIFAQNIGFQGLSLPSLTWSMEVAHFVQGASLLAIVPLSIFILVKISQRPLLSNLPHLGLMIGFVGLFFRLMVF
jgi:polyferredoxin